MDNQSLHFEILKDELLSKISSLDASLSKVSTFTKGHFIKASELISKELANDEEYAKYANNRISFMTIKRIIRNEYASNLQERRVIDTLSKLSRFLGYVDWNDFVLKKNKDYNLKHTNLEEHLANIVIQADEAEFNAYMALPSIEVEELQKYLSIEGTAYKRIHNILVRHSKKKWVINNKENPSGYKRYKLWIESISKDEAIIKTEEYWYLRWYDKRWYRYRKIYNVKNTQTWTLTFRGGLWRVTDTYYPS